MQATEYDMWYLYIKRWLREHVSKERLAKARAEYKAEMAKSPTVMPFYDWVVEYGIDGSAPACFNEWFDNEYQEGK